VREDIFAEGYRTPSALEGQIMKVSDAVAYINHDIGDALRAGVIAERSCRGELLEVLGKGHAERIDTLVCDIIEIHGRPRESHRASGS
jgi:dGTPase